jgi:PfaB family protein
MDERIAIVGMEALFGSDEGLDAFDRTVFDGLRHSVGRGAPRRKKTRAGTKSESKEDYPRLLDGLAKPGALSLLRLAIDGALRDSRSLCQGNAWGRTALIVVSDLDLTGLCVESAGPFRVDSLLLALQSAQGLLADRNVPGVVIGTVEANEERGMPGSSNDPNGAEDRRDGSGISGDGNRLAVGEGACAVVLRRYDEAKHDQDRIYARIESLATKHIDLGENGSGGTQEVARLCREAFRISGVDPGGIGYLELSGGWCEGSDPEGIEGLAQAYGTDREALTCAIGSIQANLGPSSRAAGLASLIKTALCLYHRYIPVTPGWTGPRDAQGWERSRFYAATESRPWFLDPPSTKRFAAIHHRESGTWAHLILSEEPGQGIRKNRYLQVVSPYCFPVGGDHPSDLLGQLEALRRDIEAGPSLAAVARGARVAFEGRGKAAYALMVVGHNKEELRREIEFMSSRIPAAVEVGAELKTPKGSYFTPRPLGGNGAVAFVYPGVGSAYVGLGHAIFHLFPEVHEAASGMTPDMGEALREKELYPRSRVPLSDDDIWKRELKLRKDINSIGEGGMGFFVLYTMVLRDIFKVIPQVALGYSLGEPGMIASLGVWPDPSPMTEKFRRSPIFRERLHGELTAVREYWGLGEGSSGAHGKIWDSYTLQATPDSVREAIQGEARTYLTIINGPNEVVIAGDPESCARVIQRIGCKYYPLGLHLAIHCDPARLEYDGLVDLYTLPTVTIPGIRFYSSSCYKAIPIRSRALAHSVAKAFCETVNFPRLVRQAYEDGARIFIELGSRKFCSNLIDKILENEDHLAIAVNVKGTRDESSLVRVLAQLVSHRVPVDLSPLL